MKIDQQGWLVAESGDPEMVRVPTVRTTPLDHAGLLGVVWHATGGVGGASFAERLAHRIATYRRGIDRPASWHVLIADNGAIFQSAPLSVGTWHVGRPGRVAGRWCPHVNTVTIGIELENPGELIERGGAYYAHPFWKNGNRREPDPRLRVPAERATTVGRRFFTRFTTDQFASAKALVIALTRVHRFGREALGHCHADFAAPTKVDPGALWQTVILPRLIDQALAERIRDARDEDVTVVTGPPQLAGEEARAAS